MSGIERIGSGAPQGPQRIERTQGAQPAEGAFAMGATRGPDAAAPGSAAQGAAARMRKQIDAGLAEGLGKDEILQRVVSDAMRRGLGPLASPELERTVTRAIEQDPAARELFDRLYARAVQART